jgi:hypothetical protein
VQAWAWLEVLIIFLIFFIQGAWPAPEVNEAHYLSKAKHYWDSNWCARDFFCNSADAHQVFYWSFGWMTLWLPLPAVAWTGRLLTWALLAWAWRRLSAAIIAVPFAAILSAGLFVTLMYRSHMAGEWVVGGVEAKGFAFVFGLLGIEAVVRDRWNRAWIWLGAAAAFHVLVGGWLVVTAGFAWLVMRCGKEVDRPPRLSMRALMLGGILSLPGLIPAMLLMRGVEPSVASEATRVYVFERLPHHLLPNTFPWNFLLRFTAVLVGWLWLASRKPCEAPARRLIAMVNGSLLIAAVGLLIAFAEPWFPEKAASLLRYYWFRIADVLLPVGLGLLIARWIVQLVTARSARGTMALAAAIAAVMLHLSNLLLQRGLHASPPADRQLLSSQDWQEVCRWVSENTPKDAVFLTPRLASTFRWYANRAEVVSWKDVPQDAAGIVEWWRRLRDVHGYTQRGAVAYWRPKLSNASPAELSRLAREYDATYMITESLPPLPLELVSPPNGSYSVYRLQRD